MTPKTRTFKIFYLGYNDEDRFYFTQCFEVMRKGDLPFDEAQEIAKAKSGFCDFIGVTSIVEVK